MIELCSEQILSRVRGSAVWRENKTAAGNHRIRDPAAFANRIEGSIQDGGYFASAS